MHNRRGNSTVPCFPNKRKWRRRRRRNNARGGEEDIYGAEAAASVAEDHVETEPAAAVTVAVTVVGFLGVPRTGLGFIVAPRGARLWMLGEGFGLLPRHRRRDS